MIWELENKPIWITAGVLFGLGVILQTLRPPGVILLTTSSHESAELLTTLKLAAVPLGVISLLDNNVYGRAKWICRGRDNLRQPDAVDWEAVVDELIDLTQMVVVDARVVDRP